MDTEFQTSKAASDVPVEALSATVVAGSVLSEDAPAPPHPAALSPGSTSPSGWTLVVASLAIAMAVLMILGIGFGIGYLLDLRNGVDPLGAVPNSTQCTTNT